MGQITINETLETILNLRATLMQEYLSSSSLTAIIMRSQIMPPKLIEQMALWKKSSLRKSWSRPSHYHRLMRLQTWALKNGAHHFAECYLKLRIGSSSLLGWKIRATQNSRNFVFGLINLGKCHGIEGFSRHFLKDWWKIQCPTTPKRVRAAAPICENCDPKIWPLRRRCSMNPSIFVMLRRICMSTLHAKLVTSFHLKSLPIIQTRPPYSPEMTTLSS